jgi:protein-tyrosine phosphatase/membrane-associated phospholipid phosphatase
MSISTAPPETAATGTDRPWRRGLLWLAFLGPFFFVSYGFANSYAAQQPDVGSVVFGWERQIPFLAWTIVPYWSIDFFYAASLLVARSRAEVDGHAKRLLFASVVSVICFLAFPLKYTFERPETGGLFGWMFDVLLGFDKPFNQAPSLHISLLVILWTFYARRMDGLWLWLLRTWAILIGLSVLTTYQHHFIDIPTGVLVGALAVMLFPLEPRAGVRQRDTKRWRLAGAYGVGSGVLAAVAAAFGGTWLWLFWPASALAAVAAIYAYGDASLFRAAQGRMEEAVAVWLAPYRLAAWINSRWWTRRRPAPSEVVPGLWLSRVPSSRELSAAPAALVDCCPELSIDAHGRAIYPVPMLDLLVPEIAQIEAGVAAVARARRAGSTLVFCALGYSRSATIVIAYLVASGTVATLEQAIAVARNARPELVLSPAHLHQLRMWDEQRNPA